MLDKLIAEEEKRERQQELSTQSFILRQDILSDLAPRLWKALRLSIQSWCKKHPNRFTFEVQADSQAVVRGKRKILEVEYQQQSKRVFYQIGEVGGVIRIRLNDSDDAVFVDDEGLAYSGPEYVAELMLSALL
jgi:hypothetical protein